MLGIEGLVGIEGLLGWVGGEMAEGFPVVLCGLLVVVIGLLVGIGILGAESRVAVSLCLVASSLCAWVLCWSYGVIDAYCAGSRAATSSGLRGHRRTRSLGQVCLVGIVGRD